MPRRWPRASRNTGLGIVSGGTDNHLMLVDLTAKDVTGKAAEKALDRAFLTCNKNAIPFDTRSPFVTSRHSPWHAGRHHARLRPGRVPQVGELIAEVVEGLRKQWRRRRRAGRRERPPPSDRIVRRFPVYPGR